MESASREQIYNFLNFIREEGTLDIMNAPRYINIRFNIDINVAETIFYEWQTSANHVIK
jgi:hypothetical protein